MSRQLKRCREFCEAHGWKVAAEFVDNDRSATKGERPEFLRLLESKPERIVVWHIDRLVRLTRDLESVIELGVDVHALKAGHLDLSNPAGRAVARTVTAWATYEGEQKAARQREKNDQLAEAGLPFVATRPFGFEPDGMTIRESEAAELRRAAEGVLNGRSLNSLAHGMNERGVKTATGKAWVTTTLKAALLSPRNAGMRRHRGEVIGPAAWPAILDEQTVAELHAVLNDPARRRKGPTRKYLLSGVLKCGVCGKGLSGAFIKEPGKGETYRCLGHVSRNARRVDEYVTLMLMHRLARGDAREVLASVMLPTTDQASLVAERATLRARLDGLAEAYAAGAIDLQALTAGTKRLRADLERLEGQLAENSGHPKLIDLLNANDVEQAVSSLPMESLREVIALLMDLTAEKVGQRHRLDSGIRIEWKV